MEERRGEIAEATHRVHACAVDADGHLLWQVGTDLVTTFRSAAKPFQLEVTLRLLPDDLRHQLLSADLALGAASHHGEAIHLAQLAQLLQKLGRERSHLYCGAHEPTAPYAARALLARGQEAEVLHNNCAGKHAFMAAASVQCGYPADYRPASHPLQRAIVQHLQQRSDQGNIASVTDGCGVPCFVLPLSAMARCYAQLACASDAVPRGETDRALLASPVGGLLGQIGRAMSAHPVLMSGSDAFDGWLIEQAGVIAKIGAQGLLCVALPEQGVGIAIKVESGVDQVRPVASHALLQHFFPSVFVAQLPDAFWHVRNVVGDRVGELVCEAS